MQHLPPISRREFLRLGGVAALSSVPIFRNVALGMDAARKEYYKILYVHLDGGGPTGLDSFDPKLTGTIDRPFGSIPSAVPGIRVSELFPETARRLDRVALLRARVSPFPAHLQAMAGMLQRRSNGEHLLTDHARDASGTPFAYAETPNVISAFDYRTFSLSVHKSWELKWDHEKRQYEMPNFQGIVSASRRTQREALRQLLDVRSDLSSDVIEAHEHYRHVAHRLLGGVRDILTYERKDLARYGGAYPDAAALGTLAMRELLRREIVSTAMIRHGNSQNDEGWDHHVALEKNMKGMAPGTDRLLAALIDDVESGEIEDTIIVVDSEFGRTSWLNDKKGRDHEETHWSMLFGPGVEKGVVFGRTDSFGGAEEGVVDNETFGRVLTAACTKEKKPDQRVREEVPVFA